MKWKNPQQKLNLISIGIFYLIYALVYWIIPGKDFRHSAICWLIALFIGIPVTILLARKYNPDWKKPDSNDKKVLFTGLFLLVLFLIPFVLCLFFLD